MFKSFWKMVKRQLIMLSVLAVVIVGIYLSFSLGIIGIAGDGGEGLGGQHAAMNDNPIPIPDSDKWDFYFYQKKIFFRGKSLDDSEFDRKLREAKRGSELINVIFVNNENFTSGFYEKIMNVVRDSRLSYGEKTVEESEIPEWLQNRQ